MYIALNSQKIRVAAIEAVDNGQYYCPVCHHEVILRNGHIRNAHFAHRVGDCSDSWNYDMSEWHRHKQELFPVECQEVVIESHGTVHRADVLVEDVVIEFQHSSISSSEFIDRNAFYNELGYRVAWVFDVTEQWNNKALFYDDTTENPNCMRWKYPKGVLQFGPRPSYHNKEVSIGLAWDGDDNPDIAYRVIKSSSNENGDPDYKHIELSYHKLDLKDIDDVNQFFYTREEWTRYYLQDAPQYQVKKSGEPGHPKITYRCPRWQKSLRAFGEYGCEYCRYCKLIDKHAPKSYTIYCCYPTQVNQIDNATEGEGYECGRVLVLR